MKDIIPVPKETTDEVPHVLRAPQQKKSLKGDLIHTAILMLVATAVLVGSSWLIIPHPQGASDIAAEDDPILKRTVIDYTALTTKKGDMVKYSYLGEKLPEKLHEKEVLPMRTESSYTIDKGVLENGKVGRNLQAIIYTQPAYSKRANVWYYREYAVTSKRNFDEARKTNPLTLFFALPTVHAAQFFAGAGDGQVEANGTVSWADTHDTATGNSFDYTTGTTTVESSRFTVKSTTFQIYRTFFPFDTSSIPAGATITSATLSTYVTGVLDGLNDAIDYLTVVQTSQATHTALATADYNKCGAVTTPTEGIDTGQRKDLTTLATYTYATYTLNSTGIGWIKKSGQTSNCTSTTGITCLGVREGHDTTNTAITVEAINYAYMSTADQTGTAQDPYLTVSYSSFAPWQFWDY